MIDKLANRTALFFSHRGAVCEKDIAVIQYGCANAIHMIISTMVLFIIGLYYRDIALIHHLRSNLLKRTDHLCK